MLNILGLLALYLMHSCHKFISCVSLSDVCNKFSQKCLYSLANMTRFDFSTKTSNILDKHFLTLQLRHTFERKRKKDEKGAYDENLLIPFSDVEKFTFEM